MVNGEWKPMIPSAFVLSQIVILPGEACLSLFVYSSLQGYNPMYGISLSECLLHLSRLVLCLRSGFYLYTMIWTIPLQYLMGWKRKLFLLEILARNLLPLVVYSFVHISILRIRYFSAIPPIICAVSRLSSLYPLDILKFSKKYSLIHP